MPQHDYVDDRQEEGMFMRNIFYTLTALYAAPTTSDANCAIRAQRVSGGLLITPFQRSAGVTNWLGMLFITTIFGLGFLSLVSAAGAQTTGSNTERPKLTSGAGAASGSGFVSGSFGSIAPAATADGFTYNAFYDFAPGGKNGGAYVNTQLRVSGFASDPGKSWLASAAANNVTLIGANASSYNYSAGTANWIWTTGPVFIGKPSPSQCTVIHTAKSGWIRPKYQVVSVTYAPPGSKSTATYTNGFLSGTSTSNTTSFITGVTVNVSSTMGIEIPKVVTGNSTAVFSAGWSEQQDLSNSVSVVQQNSTGEIVPGPASSGLGVDHDYDVIYVWLNPEVFLAIGSSVVGVGGYGFDGRDTVTGMDVLPLTVGQLRGTQVIGSSVQARLNRTWDSSLGALTSTELLAIARADPFANNPSFNPNTDTTHRYELPQSGSPPVPTDLIFNYVPVPSGGQATGQTYTSLYSSTSMTGQSAKDTNTVSYSIDGAASASFIVAASAKVTSSSTYSYVNQWSSTVTAGTTQSANFTIYPPLSTDNYTGRTAIQVWKDNVYGTFMFYPE
jgi:hypothetical protein